MNPMNTEEAMQACRNALEGQEEHVHEDLQETLDDLEYELKYQGSEGLEEEINLLYADLEKAGLL